MPHHGSLQFLVSFIFGSLLGIIFSLAIGISWASGFIFGGIFYMIGFFVHWCILNFFPEEDSD